MTKSDVIEKLESLKPKLREEGFEVVGLFGSFARGDFSDSSDVDILIKLKEEKEIINLLVQNGFEKSSNYEHHYVLKRYGISIEVHRKLSAIFDTKEIEINMWNSKKHIPFKLDSIEPFKNKSYKI